MELICKEEAYQVLGAAMAVHRELGSGFSENVYQDALEIEFQERGIPYEREVPIHALYHGQELKSEFVPDFVCYESVIVELKAVKELDDIFRSQAINYMKVANMDLSLLINFRSQSLQYERFPNYDKFV
jgi:GxxExxY protein